MSPQLPPSLRRAIEAELRKTPTSSWTTRRRLVLSVGILATIGSLLAMTTGRNIGALPLGSALVSVTLTAMVGLIALVVAAHPGRYGLGLSVKWLALVAISAGPIYLAATALFPLTESSTQLTEPSREAWLAIAPCGATTATAAAVGLAALLFTFRRAIPTASHLRGASLGAAAGAIAGFAMHVHCPSSLRLHIFVAHALPIVLFAVLGAVLGRKVLAP